MVAMGISYTDCNAVIRAEPKMAPNGLKDSEANLILPSGKLDFSLRRLNKPGLINEISL
jgi:hypothetical protein